MMKWDPLCTCEWEEGGIHVTSWRKKIVRREAANWRGEDGERRLGCQFVY